MRTFLARTVLYAACCKLSYTGENNVNKNNMKAKDAGYRAIRANQRYDIEKSMLQLITSYIRTHRCKRMIFSLLSSARGLCVLCEGLLNMNEISSLESSLVRYAVLTERH